MLSVTYGSGLSQYVRHWSDSSCMARGDGTSPSPASPWQRWVRVRVGVRVRISVRVRVRVTVRGRVRARVRVRLG